MSHEVLPSHPIPWRKRQDGAIVDANGDVVLNDFGADDGPSGGLVCADYIVTCVNSYDALVRALQALRAMHGSRETWPPRMRDALEMAEAAVAKARSGYSA